MDTWQLISQLEYTIGKLTWPDSPGYPMFRSVRATPGLSGEELKTLSPPFALIRPGTSARDPQRPGIYNQRIDVLLAAVNSGDQVGRTALMGGAQTVGTSKGRGVLEFEEPLHAAIDALNRAYGGIGLQSVAVSEAAATLYDDLGYLCDRVHTLEARVTTQREYPPANENRAGARVTPSPLTLTALGGGLVRVAWTPPTGRFDFHAGYAVSGSLWPFTSACGGLVLRYAAGAVAPTTPTGGSGIALGANLWTLATIDTGALALGNTSFALFAGYGELPGVTRYALDASGGYVRPVGSVVVT